MWYAFYGTTLSSESSFESRMDAVCREIGGRGRADAVVPASADDETPKVPEPEPEPEPDDDIHGEDGTAAALRAELASLRMQVLQKRAVAEGVDADAVEDALDEDNPKAALIGLIVVVTQSRGPHDLLLSCLTGGGEAAADAIDGVLESAMSLAEQLSAASPRKARKSVRDVLESLERLCDMVDDAWCDGMAQCSADELSALVENVIVMIDCGQFPHEAFHEVRSVYKLLLNLKVSAKEDETFN